MNWLLSLFEDRTYGAVRSSQWPIVRHVHLREHPTCEVCGGTDTLEVHHIRPFHLHPELELEPANLMTLCESGKNGIVCHRAIGHLGNYKSFNVEAANDAFTLRMKIKNRP